MPAEQSRHPNKVISRHLKVISLAYPSLLLALFRVFPYFR